MTRATFTIPTPPQLDERVLPLYLSSRVITRVRWQGLTAEKWPAYTPPSEIEGKPKGYFADVLLASLDDTISCSATFAPNPPQRYRSADEYLALARRQGEFAYAQIPTWLSDFESRVRSATGTMNRRQRRQPDSWEYLPRQGARDWSIRAALTLRCRPTTGTISGLVEWVTQHPPMFEGGTITVDYHR